MPLVRDFPAVRRMCMIPGFADAETGGAGGKKSFAALQHEIERIVKADIDLRYFQTVQLEEGSSGELAFAAFENATE